MRPANCRGKFRTRRSNLNLTLSHSLRKTGAHFPENALKFGVQPRGQDRDRPAVGVVGGVSDELIVEREIEIFANVVGIIGLEDLFLTVVEPSVADNDAEPAGGDEVAVRFRQGVDGATDADAVAWPIPG